MRKDSRIVVIVGGGPAGLMAAEVLSRHGTEVALFDAMPSVGRKFLMAGRGGMNITHAEDAATFRSRYGEKSARISPLLDAFGPESIRIWMRNLGVDSFVGSSGRVFPVGMKAAPLLRAWLHRLRVAGVTMHMRHRWTGICPMQDGRFELHFQSPTGPMDIKADSVVFGLGGGSWPKLGSDGQWVAPFTELNVPVTPLRPANCGFNVPWSDYLRTRFSGQPVKSVAAYFHDDLGREHRRKGEFVVTERGVEGGLIYAFSSLMRDAIALNGETTLYVDLLPDFTPRRVLDEVERPRGSRSLSSHLQSRLGLKGVKMALLNERLSREAMNDPPALACAIKSLPLRLLSTFPLEEAISSAGGVSFEALDEHLMLRELPGVFCAGEMLDWEAPTGGYLLTACLASGYVAGCGAVSRLSPGNP